MSDYTYKSTVLQNIIIKPHISEENVELSGLQIWADIMKKYNQDREELEEYLKKKTGHEQKALNLHPVIEHLNSTVFPLVQEGLIVLLEKVRAEKSCYRPKSSFNGVDFLSEYLYNMNPRYPERKDNWTYIFDIEWVQKLLKASPRKFFPYSLLWSREYAALKMQSYIRGYNVRRREDVLVMRNFWREYKLSKESQEKL